MTHFELCDGTSTLPYKSPIYELIGLTLSITAESQSLGVRRVIMTLCPLPRRTPPAIVTLTVSIVDSLRR